MDNLQRYLQENLDKGIIDHTLRASKREDGTIVFYIHAVNASSQTLDFAVDGNTLVALGKTM